MENTAKEVEFTPIDAEEQWQIATFAIERLNQLNQLSSDPEDAHREADETLLWTIECLAPHFGEQIRRAFESVRKWYA